jgi:hypothetical protein
MELPFTPVRWKVVWKAWGVDGVEPVESVEPADVVVGAGGVACDCAVALPAPHPATVARHIADTAAKQWAVRRAGSLMVTSSGRKWTPGAWQRAGGADIGTSTEIEHTRLCSNYVA